jgi:septum formation protein
MQGRGGFLVSALEGSPTNVIGLPLVETLELLTRAGVPLPWRTP